MRTNVTKKDPVVLNHAGAKALYRENSIDILKRTTMCCMLWEDSFYEDGVSIASRIETLVPKCSGEELLSLVTDIRNSGIRHAPLLIIVEMMKWPHLKPFVEDSVKVVCDRPDQLTELFSLYWKANSSDKRKGKKLPHCLIKGAKQCFQNWSPYVLAKYKQDDKTVKLRDVLRLVHPKPRDEEQSVAFRDLSKGTLKRFDTWEDRLSSGEDKTQVWTDLLNENKLGGLALIRNLRNMLLSKVDRNLIRQRLSEMNIDRIEPFRIMKAIEHGEVFAPTLEKKLFETCSRIPKIKGHTLILVDTSGSMNDRISDKSDLKRSEAGFGLAVILKEICEESTVFSFGKDAKKLPYARGFSLWKMGKNPEGGTHLRRSLRMAWEAIQAEGISETNVVIITDCQSSTTADLPFEEFKGKGFFLNVASYQPSIAHGKWEEMTGWSEKVIEYLSRKWNSDNS